MGKSNNQNTQSRRSFLKGLSIGVVGASVLSLVLGRTISHRSGRNSSQPRFAKGSIFTPAKNDPDKT